MLLKSDTPLDAALALQAASGRTKPASVIFGMGWPRSTASAPGSKAGPASVAGGGSMGRVSAGATPAHTPAGSMHTTKPRYTAKVADFGK